MPRNYKLTWQSGTSGRTGRWRKKYKGKTYYFVAGRGKSDREAYEAALSQWQLLKVQLDGAAPKQHQAEYEREIGKWEQVLTWCRKHNEADMAELAAAKLDLLRRHLTAPRPRPIQTADTFEGQFDWSTRFPGWNEFMEEISGALFGSAAVGDQAKGPLVIPPQHGWEDDSLQQEMRIWTDRLQVAARSATDVDKTVQAHVAAYVAAKQADVASGELSSGRSYVLRLHLEHFADWIGSGTPVVDITGKTLSDYRLQLLQRVEANDWSRFTAKDRLGTVKGFVRWLWQIEAIASLPRIMDAKSRALQISTPSASIVVFTKKELATLLANASDRTRLYILMGLNCAMTQKDVADLTLSEVDWVAGCITRKRSKTKEWETVPEVRYVLWQETLRLLRQERSAKTKGLVLLNENGKPLWYEEVQPNGKLKKNDNIRNAFARLAKKTKIRKPLKSLKKTSASLIRGNEKYTSLESLFLGHAAHSMADKHYAVAPQELLDQAIVWLGGQFGLK